MKFNPIDFIFIVTLIIACIYLSIYFTAYTNKGCSSCSMYEVLDKAQVNGYYSGKGFYCINTYDNNYKRITETITHEQVHALLDNEETYNHFCNNSITTKFK